MVYPDKLNTSMSLRIISDPLGAIFSELLSSYYIKLKSGLP